MTALIAVVVMHNLNDKFVVLTLQGLANSVPDLHIVTYIRRVAICYHLIQILQWKEKKDNQNCEKDKKFIIVYRPFTSKHWLTIEFWYVVILETDSGSFYVTFCDQLLLMIQAWCED